LIVLRVCIMFLGAGMFGLVCLQLREFIETARFMSAALAGMWIILFIQIVAFLCKED